MAIQRRDIHTFIFENANGVLYTVSFDDDGNGVAQKHGAKLVHSPSARAALTTTAVTVDGASLAAWRAYHVSRKAYAAVYNTAQALSAILNAAS